MPANDSSVEKTSMLREEQVAERYLRRQGISGVEQGVSVVGEPKDINTIVGKGYDLFVEKEDLRNLVVKEMRGVSEHEPTSGVPLTLAEKKELIRQGRVSSILGDQSGTFQEVVSRSQARIEEIENELAGIFSTEGAFDKFKEDLTHQVRIRHQANEVRKLESLIDNLGLSSTRVARNVQVQKRQVASVERQTIEDNRELAREAKKRISEIIEDPEVAERVRTLELKEYNRQLKKDGFAETPSRVRYMDRLAKLWSQNKKVIVTGATGTGKTELVRHASRKFFGTKPFELTGHRDMTPYELLGRTGMTVRGGEGSDVYRPSKLVQAMAGEGTPFLYDEMDAAPNEANIAIKTLLNDGPGDKIGLQMDSQDEFVIGSNYSFTGTANVKSEKHSTRFEIDPAIVRILEPMILPYMPPQEVWDIAVASLVDSRGGLPLSEQNARVVLRNLCDSAYWIQQAYLGNEIVLDPKRGTVLEARGGGTTGKRASLKEAVVDPGKLAGMLKGWDAARLNSEDFTSYIDEQLVRFVNNENYPEEDRYYLVEIFALKGFLKNNKVEDFNISGLDAGTFNRWKGSQSEEELEKDSYSYLNPSEVARLDPYNLKGRPVTEDARELLRDELPQETYRSADQMIERAREVLGQDFLGIEAIRAMEEKFKAIGINVEFPLDNIPFFPYSEQDLQFAKENGEFLTFRPNRMILDGKDLPVTIANLVKLFDQDPTGNLRSVFQDERKMEQPEPKKGLFGRVSRPPAPSAPWYTNATFTGDLLSSGWAITSKDILPRTTSKRISDENPVFQNHNDWLKTRGCRQAKIPTAEEMIWDILLRYVETSERLLPKIQSFVDTYTDNLGSPITIGNFSDTGIEIGRIVNYERSAAIGAVSSR